MLKNIIAPAVILCAAVIIWFLLLQAEPQQPNVRAAKPNPVNILYPQKKPVSDSIEAVGSTIAIHAIDVTGEVDGRLHEIHFTEGAEVVKGQLLALLDDRMAQAELVVAEAQLQEISARHNRARRLLESRHISDAEFEEIKAALQVAQATAEAADIHVAQHRIIAPFDGIVGLREVSPGAWLKAGSPITTLDDQQPMGVLLAVPERFLGNIRSKIPIEARSDAFPGKTFRGEITSIGARVDRDSRNLQLKAVLENSNKQLRPGQFLSIRIMLEPRLALVIPEEAVITAGNTQSVFVALDNKAQRRRIEAGQRNAGSIEVLRGLSEQDAVIINGQNRLRDGAPVQVLDDPDPLPGRPVGADAASGRAQ